jgi:hypothetical protein
MPKQMPAKKTHGWLSIAKHKTRSLELWASSPHKEQIARRSASNHVKFGESRVKEKNYHGYNIRWIQTPAGKVKSLYARTPENSYFPGNYKTVSALMAAIDKRLERHPDPSRGKMKRR